MEEEAAPGVCLKHASWMDQGIGTVEVKGSKGYCFWVIQGRSGFHEPCRQPQGRGQACSIWQKCQGKWEAITLVIRTSLLTFKSRTLRRACYWKPDCSELQGRCIWGNGGLVARWRCLLAKGESTTESMRFFFLRRRNCYFESRV